MIIKLSQSLNNPSIYELQEYDVSNPYGNFIIPLDVMRKELSDKGLLDTWKIRVKDFDGNLTYALYNNSDLKNEHKVGVTVNGVSSIFTAGTVNAMVKWIPLLMQLM